MNFKWFETTHFFYRLHHMHTYSSSSKKKKDHVLFTTIKVKTEVWSQNVLLHQETWQKKSIKKNCLSCFFQNNTQRKYDNTSWRQVRKGKFNWTEASHEQSVRLIHIFLYCLGTLFPSLLDQIQAKRLLTFCLSSLFCSQCSPLN